MRWRQKSRLKGLRPQNPPARVFLRSPAAYYSGQSAQADFVAERSEAAQARFWRRIGAHDIFQNP